MQNRTNSIEERLQIINDYIQRTMDALNATRQVVQGISASTNYQQGFVSSVPNVSGFAHSTLVPQLVQTPYGIVAVDPRTLGYGLHHASFVSPLSQLPVSNFGSSFGTNFGVSQFQVPQIPSWGMLPQLGVNYNYGWANGLSHSPFVSSQVNAWGVPVTIAPQWPINQQVVPQNVVPQNVVPQTVVPNTTF
jgi:hypothetical protein